MATEKLRTAVRREQIAEAALDLISSGGVKALSVGAVARRIGIVPSAVYRHFRGKEEIVSAAIARMGDRLLENVVLAAREGPTAIGCLRKLLQLHIRTIREGRAGPRIVFAEGIGDGRTPHRAEIYRVIRRYIEKVAEIVREGQSRGEIRADIDPEAAAIHFIGLIQPAATLWHFSDGRFDVTRHAERSFALFAELIEAR
jgi:AcrR family transcriptional regulator